MTPPHWSCVECGIIVCMANKEIGSKYGKLTVLKRAESRKGHTMYKCRCDCGTVRDFYATHLRRGKSLSCGCVWREKRQARAITEVGKKYGKWLVIGLSERRGRNGELYYKSVCDCGTERDVLGQSLRNGKSKGCGCGVDGRKSSRANYRSDNGCWTGYKGISGREWGGFRRSAEARSISFEVTIEEAWELYKEQNGKCALTGIPVEFTNGGTHKTASLDRIDSSKPYTIDNVQWVHKDVNLMKRDFSQDYFFKLCKKIAKRN